MRNALAAVLTLALPLALVVALWLGVVEVIRW